MKKKMQRIKLGKITSPVGIKGEIRVYPYLDQARFSDIEKVCIENSQPAAIEKLRIDKNMLVIKLEDVNDRNASEMLRGKELYLPLGEKLDLGEDNYLIEDLIGLTVKSESGEVLGKIKDVISRTVQDLYEIERLDGKSFLLPAVKEFIKNIDLEKQTMTVRLPEGITDL